MALNRPSPWSLECQNPVPITHTVGIIYNMGINCPGNTENQVLCLKKLGKGFFLKDIIKKSSKILNPTYMVKWLGAESPIL